MQLYANIYFLLKYPTFFGRPSRHSSGVHNTIVAVSRTDRTIWLASFFKRDKISPYLATFEDACPQRVRSVPEAAAIDLCTPDEWRDGRPKHVQ